uniref:Uncharacterized protein n=1 Tax=Caenorhabditis japonica TaxID=281687 RepID=A0A8R1ECX5_CAEJA
MVTEMEEKRTHPSFAPSVDAASRFARPLVQSEMDKSTVIRWRRWEFEDDDGGVGGDDESTAAATAVAVAAANAEAVGDEMMTKRGNPRRLMSINLWENLVVISDKC